MAGPECSGRVFSYLLVCELCSYLGYPLFLALQFQSLDVIKQWTCVTSSDMARQSSALGVIYDIILRNVN